MTGGSFRLAVLSLVGVQALVGCATSSLLMLPGEGDNPTGAVAILDADGTDEAAVVDQGYTRTRLGQRPVSRPIDPRDITPAEQRLIASLPPSVLSFPLYFLPNSTQLTSESERKLEEMLLLFGQRPGVEVDVVGHTDTTGDEPTNDRVSLDRANAIAELLVARGVARELITAVGRGESDPAVRTDDGVDEPRNRRVELVVR